MRRSSVISTLYPSGRPASAALSRVRTADGSRGTDWPPARGPSPFQRSAAIPDRTPIRLARHEPPKRSPPAGEASFFEGASC